MGFAIAFAWFDCGPACNVGPERIIEPEPIKEEWDRGDPRYSAMVQQVVGKISTRPGKEQEMGSVSGSSPVLALWK